MPAASLGSLFRETKKSFFLRRNDFLVFILLGTVIFGITSGILEVKRNMVQQELAQELGVDNHTAGKLWEQHQRNWMSENDSDALVAALQQKEIDPAAYLRKLEKKHLAGEGLLGLATGLIGLVSGPWLYASYILLALNRKKSWKETSRAAWNKFLTVLGISFLNALVFMGAFALAIVLFFVHPALGGLGILAWIIFLGVLAPRLSLAPVVSVIENKDAMKAWKMTYKATNRYWGKIVGNGIVFVLLVLLVFILSMIVFGILSAIVGSLEPVLGLIALTVSMAFVQQCVMAYGIIFATKLTETILAHPRKS